MTIYRKCVNLAIFWLILLVPHRQTLECYLCSVFAPDFLEDHEQECPIPEIDDAKQWQSLGPLKYENITGGDNIVCAVGYSKSTGKVFHQSGFSSSQCNDDFKQRIQNQIRADGIVTCCTKDGCNWNGTTAELNLSFKEFYKGDGYGNTGGTMPSSPDYLPYYIIGCVAFLLLMCIFIFCCIRFANKSKRKEHQDKQILSSLYENDGKFLDVASNKSNVTSSRTIKVRQSPDAHLNVMELCDHERYSAIDNRLYRNPYNKRTRRNSAGDISNFNSKGSTPSQSTFINDDLYDEHNKQRIGDVSKHLFDNADFKTVYKRFRSADERQKRRVRPDWVSDAPKNRPNIAQPSRVNPFRFVNSA